MFQTPQGIPNLPDLTHPQELINLGQQFFIPLLILILLVGGLGLILALFNRGLTPQDPDNLNLIGQWKTRYFSLLRGLEQSILVLIIVIVGFFLCSTLANRYHHWEQAKLSKIAATVAGERLEQTAPRVRYHVEEPYSYYTQVDGQFVQVQDTRKVDRFLTLTRSEIEVNVNQSQNLQQEGNTYLVDFKGVYQMTNSLPQYQELFFEISPPYNYSLLKNFRVERQGNQLTPITPNQFSFPISLEPNQQTQFQVSYQAQGAPRWVYNAGGDLLSNFRLTVKANFPQADFASGITPSEIKYEGQATIFTWIFAENVSVANPFGLFTATESIKNTGIIPRLLMLAPGIFLWWVLLLVLSVPLQEKDLAIAAGIFFASLLALTYFSRILDVKIAWAGISLIWLILVWGLGKNIRTSLAAVICTLAGAILPMLGLLVPYSGLTLSLAGLLSVIWLTVKNWYSLRIFR
ncbi:conserved hypothetical protein [Gloeothece citriformis PCC 7424]|uniref:Uncharacterized protein n=1 Tax=Gloeothece citriformis (strain PCC 7424) TaxID=65393 RepID=B7KD10_GLOC7|nr:hypothetical protein [Gloeothece citriformis]ACK73131.1 conserved hypothetical protein [Gloeothece citriformis PCC 7424]